MAPRARSLPKWPKELAWYDPKAYAQAGDLGGLSWHGLLLERRQALNGPQSEALEALKLFQHSPLGVHSVLVSHERPVESFGFDDLTLVGALLGEESVRQALQQWDDREPYNTRALKMIFKGEPLSPISGALHDHHIALVHEQDGQHPLLQQVRYAYLRVNLAVPDALLTSLFQAWLEERRARLREAGLEQGAAPRRSRKTVARLGPQQYRSWAELRVLDYLDLKLACRVAGIPEPALQQLGAKLFPDDRPRRGTAARSVDTTDRIAQQTKPLADQLMTPGFLEHFHEQLKGEVSLED